MWRTTERRFVGQVCLRNLFQAPSPYQKQVHERDSTFHKFCIMVASFRGAGRNLSRQPFSCRCFVTHYRKEICWTGLSKESIPAIPFGISKHPLPTRNRFMRGTVRSTNSALCLHHAHPFVAAAETNESHAEKQRVWSRSCGLQGLLRTIHWVIVSKVWVTGYWLCSQLWHVTAANQWRIVEIDKIEILASVGWKWGCQPFSCRCSQNVTDYRKEICWTGLSKESIPSTQSLPETGSWEGQYVPQVLHYGCVIPRCRKKLVSPAFQLPMFSKCDALPKGDL